MKIGKRAYAEMFGPTAGDRVRLADTDLIVEVERDLTVYGEEVKFGGGKVIRDGMGQSQRAANDCADTVVTNALVIDWWGVVKCDIAIKDGRIAKLGKAGDVQAVPETLEASLQLAARALESLGVDEETIDRLVDLHREGDYAALAELGASEAQLRAALADGSNGEGGVGAKRGK